VAAQLERLVARLLPLTVADGTGARRLPPERELCARLDMSRAALREQLAMLENLGLLRRRQGHGSYLDAPDAGFVHTAFTLMRHVGYLDDASLTEARELLEETIAVAAAPLVTDDDLAELRALADEILRATDADDHLAAAQADLAFHRRLFVIVDNPIISMVGEGLGTVLSENVAARRRLALAGAERVPGRPISTDAVHLEIVAALETRDPAAARAAMRRHFSEYTMVAGTPGAEATAQGENA
jgi:DNA-binding FadR family transcriptional regulator